MISLSFSVDDLQLRPDQQAIIERGASPLDADEVYFQFLCTTEDGGHDPEGEPDAHVRDSHAALHGSVWNINNPLAPVPPIGYGCRCAMRYVGKDGTPAAGLLGAETDGETESIGEVFGKWLADNVVNWKQYAKVADEAKQADKLGAVYERLKEQGVKGDLREISRMVMSAVGKV